MSRTFHNGKFVGSKEEEEEEVVISSNLQVKYQHRL